MKWSVVYIFLLSLVLSVTPAMGQLSRAKQKETTILAELRANMHLKGKEDPEIPTVDEGCPSLKVCPHKCKKKSTALKMAGFLGLFGCGRLYLGHVQESFYKLAAGVLGVCVPLCHLYIYGFHAANNDHMTIHGKSISTKKPTKFQICCRCYDPRIKFPFTQRNIPCLGWGNPLHFVLFLSFLYMYISDLISIKNNTLTAKGMGFEKCYRVNV